MATLRLRVLKLLRSDQRRHQRRQREVRNGEAVADQVVARSSLAAEALAYCAKLLVRFGDAALVELEVGYHSPPHPGERGSRKQPSWTFQIWGKRPQGETGVRENVVEEQPPRVRPQLRVVGILELQ